MKCTAEFLDISPFVEKQLKPVWQLKRGDTEVWQARMTPMDFTEPNHTGIDWMLVRMGDVVPIPLIPYRVNSLQLPELVLSVANVVQCYSNRFPNPVRTHLIIGRPVEDLRPETEALRFWLGFALQAQ